MWEKRGVAEGCLVIVGLIGLQLVYAGNSVLVGYLMSMGINPRSLVIFTSMATALILSPLCFYFERSKWPENLTFSLIVRLIFMAFGGVTLFQLLFLKGIQLTSPTIATAMPNLAPALIFVIAWALRLERVKLRCMYSKVKIVGTLLCVAGAIGMSILQSTPAKPAGEISSSPWPNMFDKEKVIGSMYLMAAVLLLSINIILQATTLIVFPAPMSLCALTSLIGAFITVILELIQYRHFEYGWMIKHFKGIFGYSILGGIVAGACVSFNGWALKKRGPVVVSMFSPVATVFSLVLSMITLGECINLASLASMFVVFSGLYLVLWAKGKEGYSSTNSFGMESDAMKPLLS